jgi:hypothetical protein
MRLQYKFLHTAITAGPPSSGVAAPSEVAVSPLAFELDLPAPPDPS